MNEHSRQTVLWVFPLALTLWACGAAAPSAGPKNSVDPMVSESKERGDTVSPARSAGGVGSTSPLAEDKRVDFKVEPPKSPIAQASDGGETLFKDDEGSLVLAALPSQSKQKNEGARARGSADTLSQGGEGAMMTRAASPMPPPYGSSTDAAGGGSGGTQRPGSIGAASEMRGTIEKAVIQQVVKANVKDVQQCYETGLTRRPGLEGTVRLKFVVGKTGTVTAASVFETSLNERQVEQCIVSAALKWVFPKPSGEGLATFAYPFILKSAQ